jgi:predicted phage terminase large subunit-like protein
MSVDHRAIKNLLIKNDFLTFSQLCFQTLNPATPFERNWHLQAIAWHLRLVHIGKIRRLIILAPPRSLKSLMCSVAFPAFILGHDPSARIICVSYGSDLSTKLSNDCRTILQTPWFPSLFPGMRISRSKNSESEIVTTQHGYRLATSVGGSLTGRGGGYVIIDDPMKAQDAFSQKKREAINEWFLNTVLSRLDDQRTGAIIVVMQRLHADDPAGMLLRSSDEWTVLKLSAIALEDERIQIGEDTYHYRTSGNLLHAQRLPRELLDEILAHTGEEHFAAQYLQEPTGPDGKTIKRDWVRRYDEAPTRTSSTYVLQSWDPALKPGEGNSWSVCTTWYVVECKYYYLIDVFRARADYPTLKEQAKTLARHYSPTTILIEDTGIGTGLATELRNERFPIVGVQVEHNKLARMSVQSGKFANGQVLLPRQAPWLKAYEEEIFSFPDSRSDDQVDSTSQALGYKIRTSVWNDKALEGLSRFTQALVMDQYLARVTGRPW